MGTLAEIPELPNAGSLVAPNTDKGTFQGKSENLNVFSMLKMGPKNSAWRVGEQEARKEQASTSQGQQSPEVGARSHVQLHYLFMPTSGPGLPLYLQSQYLGGRK